MPNQIWSPEKNINVRSSVGLPVKIATSEQSASEQPVTQPAPPASEQPVTQPAPPASEQPVTQPAPPASEQPVTQPAPPASEQPTTQPTQPAPPAQPQPAGELSLGNIKTIFRLLLSEDIDKIQANIQIMQTNLSAITAEIKSITDNVAKHNRSIEHLESIFETTTSSLRNEIQGVNLSISQANKQVEEKLAITTKAFNETIEHQQKELLESIEKYRGQFQSFVAYLRAFEIKPDEQLSIQTKKIPPLTPPDSEK